MKYLFYPGCSIAGSTLEYRASTLAVLEALGAEVQELEDWTCCGASVAPVLSSLLGAAMPARNLALAERSGEGQELVVACSNCYIAFQRTAAAIKADPSLLATVNRALEAEGLTYQGTVVVRHLLDILANDFEPETIAARVRRPLTGLTVAPYYGCQTVRPYSAFDDPERPTSMVGILEALGASVHRHAREASCCGSALLLPKPEPEVGLRMAGAILEASNPADCIVTVCPLCHTNLDSYQDRVSRMLSKTIRVPILFLPQLMALAFELPKNALMFGRHVVAVNPMLALIKKAR